MKLTVIGTGFVGVVTSAVFASFGNEVIGLDIDQAKVDSLKKSTVPFYEPGLEELLTEQQKNGSLSFTTNYQEAVSDADVIMLAVPTPSDKGGGADLKYLFSAAESLSEFIKDGVIVAVKSTVPPGTLPKVAEKISAKTDKLFMMASLPEFLKEGSAVADTLQPDRVVIGVTDDKALAILTELHTPLNAPIIGVSPESAQMAKYTANAYLATRITFINQIADLCEKNGADIQEVITVIGKDRRIGEHYWYPGMGYGGSCFPKDVKELAYYSRSVGEGENLFNKMSQINEQRIPDLLSNYETAVGGWEGKKVAVLGLSFKPNTDDMREAPSTKVVPELLAKGAVIKAYDPKALEVAQKVLPHSENISYVSELEQAISDVDVIFILVEWPEIITYDFSKQKLDRDQWLIDVRNQLDPKLVNSWGYKYLSIGRKSHD